MRTYVWRCHNWSTYAPWPTEVLIFCTHRVHPNPINHVCERLISTLLALFSFSWLSARFIMAFWDCGCGKCVFVCVWASVVMLWYGSMLLSMSPCSKKEWPKCALSVHGFTSMLLHISAISYLLQTVVSSLQQCVWILVTMTSAKWHGVPACYHSDSKCPF